MTSIEVLAPAKVNIFLKVLGKRKDSYHNILTLFERVSLADKIRISRLPKDKGIILVCDKKVTKSAKDNLAYRAARLLLDFKKVKAGVRIELKKRIPVSAGLGGGSSDAAAVLLGINRLLGLKVSQKALMRLAGKLGADVPFFVSDTPFALGSKRGDELRPISSKAPFWHLLIWPGFGSATRDIYEAFDASGRGGFALTSAVRDARITFPLKDPLDFSTAESMLSNDLEEIARSKNRVIGSTIERLARVLDKRVILSGSGPSLFCLYRTKKEVVAAKKRLLGSVPASERKPWQVFMVKTC